PILPNRLAFPEILPITCYPENFYDNFPELFQRLETALQNISTIRNINLGSAVEKYSWQHLALLYDRHFEKFVVKFT
ncbi:MAG: DUF3524 domain-containing protein, partial [bacterium]|nr:DUF3524 domain-containing protein [bacterium]